MVNQEVQRIIEEVRAAMERMRSGKAVDPDGIPVEVWRRLLKRAVDILSRLFNTVLQCTNFIIMIMY